MMKAQLRSLVVGFSILLLLYDVSYSIDLEISPVRVFFDPKAKAATLSLKNKGQEDINLQIRSY